MKQEEKRKALRACLYEHCSRSDCDECKFYDEEGIGEDEYECGIRDNKGNIPYNKKWNVKEALGFEEAYKPVFPKEVRGSIMNHFTKVE